MRVYICTSITDNVVHVRVRVRVHGKLEFRCQQKELLPEKACKGEKGGARRSDSCLMIWLFTQNCSLRFALHEKC